MVSPLTCKYWEKKPPGAFFETPFPTDNPHFKRPGIDFEKALFVPDEFIIPIRNTLPQEQAKLINEQSNIISDDFEQYILKLENISKKSPSYRFSTVPLFPEGMEKIKQITLKESKVNMKEVNNKKPIEELKSENEELKTLQKEAKEKAISQSDDGTKIFEFQFYDDLDPGSFNADNKTVKINFTARDTIKYQHHQFVAEADVLSPINHKNKVHLSTERFFEDNQDIEKKLGVLDWTESFKKFQVTMTKSMDSKFLNDEENQKKEDINKLREIAKALNTSVKETDAEKFSKLSSNKRQAILSELASQQHQSSEYPSNKPEIGSPDFEI